MTSEQPTLVYLQPAQFVVTLEQTPGIFSNLVHNMRGLSVAEKITIIAASILLIPVSIVSTVMTTGATPRNIALATVIAPPIAMYIITDLVKAVKMFLKDMGTQYTQLQ